ncbi:hypothetical protein LY28_01318 [Ruminiclostridium sufflavum DSM 19573]|uniref:Uncharacterized protein n=1 Tax=Ruminiclostridium sufflavum DSM 19573 TaxID=1121337 RepID=A0A318XNF0_9FIRM|nr:DUF6075 family protein [Ruminiclostridium sufflavum]PYG88469.1 hypothetical protein LY28_01318 [Ruminiclostridium sufflavum DSM 19573]
MLLKFKDIIHKDFFESMVKKTNCKNDPYRAALFYTLGLTAETRCNINLLYNFKENCIEFDGLNAGWQTGTTIRLCRLAFNLYNGFTDEQGDGKENKEGRFYSPYWLFDCSLIDYMLEAIKIRYAEYSGYKFTSIERSIQS